MSTNNPEFMRNRPLTSSPDMEVPKGFRNRLFEAPSRPALPIVAEQFWMGDWRLGIAEERVALAEERLARAEAELARTRGAK